MFPHADCEHCLQLQSRAVRHHLRNTRGRRVGHETGDRVQAARCLSCRRGRVLTICQRKRRNCVTFTSFFSMRNGKRARIRDRRRTGERKESSRYTVSVIGGYPFGSAESARRRSRAPSISDLSDTTRTGQTVESGHRALMIFCFLFLQAIFLSSREISPAPARRQRRHRMPFLLPLVLLSNVRALERHVVTNEQGQPVACLSQQCRSSTRPMLTSIGGQSAFASGDMSLHVVGCGA